MWELLIITLITQSQDAKQLQERATAQNLKTSLTVAPEELFTAPGQAEWESILNSMFALLIRYLETMTVVVVVNENGAVLPAAAFVKEVRIGIVETQGSDGVRFGFQYYNR